MTALVLGLAWGLLAAGGIVARARRRSTVHRLPRRTRSRRRSCPGRSRFVASLAAHRQARRDALAFEAALPAAADLLAVAVRSGAPPPLAVELVAPWTPPAAARRLDAIVRAQRVGATFADALARLSAGDPAFRPLGESLALAHRLGAPVAPALDRLAGELRAAARRAAEARARTMPVKLLFPLVFLVLPAFVLLTVVPALLAGFGAR